MKHNDVKNVSVKLSPQNYERIFNVYVGESNEYFYNLIRTVNFPKELDPSVYTNYTTVLNDTWPGIAWQFYRNVKLWWVICAVNQIINPVLQPKVGTQLKILSINVLKTLLNNLE